MNEIIVQKFGGTSVATPAKIKHIARFIEQGLTGGQRILVVVSAMGQATNDLIALAHEVSIHPPKRELDMLISCGERTSMALLAMALCDLGIKAMSLTGSQSGIITDDNHSEAEITAIMPNRVIEALSTHQVVIIAGFQGVSSKKEITTLRRGGSDTTAVAMAAALKAQACEIYTDVDGVFDADPRLVKSAQVLKEVAFPELMSMSLYGARVMAHDAARLAHEFGIAVKVAKTGSVTQTLVKSLVKHEKKVVAITHLRGVLRVICDRGESLPEDQSGYFLCASMRDMKLIGYSSNDITQELLGLSQEVDRGLAMITIHLSKNKAALSIYSKLDRILGGVAILDLIIGSKEIFIVVEDNDLTLALNLLHNDLLKDE